MAATETKSVIVAVKLTPTMHAQLRARSVAEDATASDVLRWALRDYLKGQVTK